MKRLIMVFMTFITVAAIYGCGSGGSGGVTINDDNKALPAGQATLAFSAISTARLDSSIGGITMRVTLPAGMHVATDSANPSWIASGNVLAGSALSGTNLAFGSYSATVRKATLTMATSSSSYRSGQFLRLICTVDPNTSITVGALKALNNPVTMVKAAGYDQATSSTTVLTSKLKLSLDVVQ